MIYCAVNGCTSSEIKTPTLEFFSFPKLEVFSQWWIKACGLQNQVIDTQHEGAKICAKHFEEVYFVMEVKIQNKRAFYARTLKEDAVPTLNLPDLTPDECLTQNEANEMNEQSENENLQELLNENEKLLALIKRKEQIVDRLRLQQAFRKNKLSELKKSLNKLTPHAYLPAMQQKQLLQKVFTENQIKLLYGKSKAHWTDHEMAVAYTVRYLSNRKFFDYLTQKLNFPLPGLSSVRRWFAINCKSKKFNRASKKRKHKE